MKKILLFIIYTYCYLIPENKRKTCIFEEACSKYIFRITNESGLYKGIKALVFRILNCNSEYDIFRDYKDNLLKIRLKNGLMLDENNISIKIRKRFYEK